MTITRVGSNSKYASGWNLHLANPSRRRASAAKSTTRDESTKKVAAAKKATSKTAAKKAPAKKAATATKTVKKLLRRNCKQKEVITVEGLAPNRQSLVKYRCSPEILRRIISEKRFISVACQLFIRESMFPQLKRNAIDKRHDLSRWSALVVQGQRSFASSRSLPIALG